MPATETFHGFIETTTDTLLIFEACRRGILPKINRRLQERERGAVKSGTVYVFDERESGIKRWTDGYVWSPSRILGNFLIYRELDGRDSVQDRRRPISYNGFNNAYRQQQHQPYPPPQQILNDVDPTEELDGVDRNRERALVGSLTTSYNFKKGGLIKKTMSVVVNGSAQHLISYYTKEDVLNHRLSTPSSIPELASLEISPELLMRQSFRVPPMAEHVEVLDHPYHQTTKKFAGALPSPAPYSLIPSSQRRRASEAFPVSRPKTSRTGSLDSPTTAARHHMYMEPFGHPGYAPHQQPAPVHPHHEQQQHDGTMDHAAAAAAAVTATTAATSNTPRTVHDMSTSPPCTAGNMMKYSHAPMVPFHATMSPPPFMESRPPISTGMTRHDIATESPPPSPFYGRPRKSSMEGSPIMWQHHQQQPYQHPVATATRSMNVNPTKPVVEQYRSPLSMSTTQSGYYPTPLPTGANKYNMDQQQHQLQPITSPAGPPPPNEASMTSAFPMMASATTKNQYHHSMMPAHHQAPPPPPPAPQHHQAEVQYY